MKLFTQSRKIALQTLLPKENGQLKRILRIMKLTAVLILIACLQVGATTYAQKVTLKAHNVALENVLKEIKKQTGYTFLYSNELMKKANKVSVELNNVVIKDALNDVFKAQPLNYSFNEKTILIIEKRASIWDKVNDILMRMRVQGKVVDSVGNPLAGASVKIVGQNVSRSTNSNGEFILENVQSGDVLRISYLGFQPVDRRINGNENKPIVVVLQRDITQLQQVAVISTGYQKVNKSQLTGAASTIGEKDYNQRVAVTGNFLENLEGKVPGLVYNGISGEISIRGVSTFDAVKRPLIVVDGFPTEIDLSTINPNDVVSVSVLRDAAAASIYGVQASNGVIVVETRRGKSGKPVFNFRSTSAFQSKPDFGYMKYMGSEEFVQLNRDYVKTGNDASYFYDDYTPMDPVRKVLFDQEDGLLTEQQANEKIAAIGSYNNLSDYKRLFYQNRLVKQINLDVSGGGDKSTYLLGLNYVGERPDEIRSKNNRVILNVANTYQFNKTFSFDFKGIYTNNQQESGKTAPYADLLPYDRLIDATGTALPATFGELKESFYAINAAYNAKAKAVGLYDQAYYPYEELFANTNKQSLNSFRGQGRLNAKITSWLNLDLGGAYENEQGINDQLRTEKAYSVRYLINSKAKKDPVKGTPLFIDLPKGDFLTKQTLRKVDYTLRGQFNANYYSKDSKHNISGILGMEQRKTQSDSYKTTFFGYDGQSLINKPVNLQVLNSTITPVFPEVGSYGSRFNSASYYSETYDDRRFRSLYGQATYVYDRRYVATGSLRIDQSNLFGVDPKYKNKPLWSAGLNWVINEEAFMKPLEWVNTLQLRAATGFNGNVPSSFNGPFLLLNSRLNTMFSSTELFYDVLSPENQSIRWETTHNYNVGLDYGLLDNRLTGSVDVYYKKTKDVFGILSADPTLGFNQYNANTAAIENKGLELMISSLNVATSGFNWRTGLTAAFNKNKVLAVQPKDKTSSYDIVTGTDLQKGYPMNAVFSYKYAGLNALGQPGVYDRNGDIKIMNTYGDAIVDVDFEDLKYSGTTTPKYVIGLNNQFTIGAFDFSFLFMYYGGHIMRVQAPNPDDMNYNFPLQGSAGYWKVKGDELKTNIPGFPEYGTPGDFSYAARYGYTYGDTFVRKADYIRLRDVILTYNLKNAMLKKIGLSNSQIRFQAQNPFKYTFSGNDVDPEFIDKRTGERSLPQRPFYSLTLSTNF
ncbi:SusC/RagA family TonB-linked outer membrane protein [Pedobacter sp. MC2016-24]|uniref:SusC/RagA family TonB-linked outer membrane protein n=1 Tax=Pedobacter sp. MC2016-24 TaxID=2780090 RepID=UPI00188248A8|nr:SusC/RagA family TonB-linked outer membrane protein [Pedobacter sp. MC2016-24]MBE9601164.1 SusC/RagA family TonB-linked outer membrane protein [Pedobacter sp. MC2016-24]